MKTALIVIILISTSVYSLGQNLDDSDDLNCSLQDLQLAAPDADQGKMLPANIAAERNLFSPLAIQWDRQKNENKNVKFKITFSDSWFTRDKAHHFLTSAFLSAAGYYLLREEQKFSNQESQTGGFFISLSLGLAKEFRDGLRNNSAFSAKDFVANLLGIAVGIMIISD
jgi:putative lipoprotein